MTGWNSLVAVEGWNSCYLLSGAYSPWLYPFISCQAWLILLYWEGFCMNLCTDGYGPHSLHFWQSNPSSWPRVPTTPLRAQGFASSCVGNVTVLVCSVTKTTSGFCFEHLQVVDSLNWLCNSFSWNKVGETSGEEMPPPPLRDLRQTGAGGGGDLIKISLFQLFILTVRDKNSSWGPLHHPEADSGAYTAGGTAPSLGGGGETSAPSSRPPWGGGDRGGDPRPSGGLRAGLPPAEGGLKGPGRAVAAPPQACPPRATVGGGERWRRRPRKRWQEEEEQEEEEEEEEEAGVRAAASPGP